MLAGGGPAPDEIVWHLFRREAGGYAYIVAVWLREFAKTFPGTAVCDLTRELLNAYMASHSDVTARTRNGRRSVLGKFLKEEI